MLSTILDLPQPFGPTIPVILSSKLTIVLSAKLLKPLISKLFSLTVFGYLLAANLRHKTGRNDLAMRHLFTNKSDKRQLRAVRPGLRALCPCSWLEARGSKLSPLLSFSFCLLPRTPKWFSL